MDPLTLAGAGLAVLGSKDLLNKVLGPSADYIGGEMKGLIEKCNINLDQVFQKAKQKLGTRLDEDGGVSPRVLKHVFDEGRFADDAIVVEYYGGMLAGSKSATSADDRALPYLAKVQQLPSAQLRLHFIFYLELLRAYRHRPFNLADGKEWPKHTLILPHSMFLQTLAGTPHLEERYWEIMAQSVAGLHEAGLVSTYQFGKLEGQASQFEKPPQNGILLGPNYLGAELFLWALGIESPSALKFFETQYESIEKPIPVIGEASARVASP